MFLKRAEAIYEENLNAYVKIVLRRPFSKIIVSPTMSLTRSLTHPRTGVLRGRGASSEDDRTFGDIVEQQLLKVCAQEGGEGV